ncbi:hypothetical protein C2845_PM07G08980 [Panicum miliaceum]|uniref:Aminotransferase-like plant mobile domain-containing protein n=1 Tax=Panicum miliaceum TaxID=4540 RepID=A0A3L6SP01_PANMI|nr:hypothetical protein C2845_PM07G08980 [Panicum miliaceum]
MEKESFSSNLKLGKFRTLLKNLSSDQKDLVKSCGFGSILDFDCSEAPRSVSFWLAKRFDVHSRTVNLQNGSSFALNPFTVHQILGIPLGGRKIPTKASKLMKDVIGDDTGTATIAPTVDHLFSLLNSELTGEKFVCIFMLIALAIFLCPTSYGSVSSHYYSGIVSVKDISKYDWCSFVLDWLVTSIQKFQESTQKGDALGKEKTSSLGACRFVLVVTYFEYINTSQILLCDDIPRLRIWDDYMIHEFLALDGNSGDGRSFGMLQLKDASETPFLVPSISSSSFSRLPAQVEDFISCLAPDDEHQNVRNQLSHICRSFYKDLMASCLAAIQPVVIKQMCTMATVMRDGLSRSTTDGRSTGDKTSHLGSHRTSPHRGSAANGSFADISTSSQGINVANTRPANPEKPTEVPRNVVPTQLSIDPLPRSTSYRLMKMLPRHLVI